MAKVLFVNPVVREEDVPRHVPYGIALLAAIIMDKGHQVQIYDANAWRQGDDVLREVLGADDWQVIAIGGITTSYGSIKNIVRHAREVCPKALIALGGGVLTSMPRDIMTFLPQVDVGCIGEGFITFPEMLDVVDNGSRDFSKVLGTISRGADGRYIIPGERPLLENLDTLPYPAWDLFPLEEVYFKNSQALFSEEGYLTERRLDINASFGCSLICRYCYHLGLSGDMRYQKNADGETDVSFDEPGNYTRTIRYHSPEYIVKMVKHVRDKYKVDFVAFLDENLMTMDQYSGRTWLKEICRLWHEYDLAPVDRYNEQGELTGWSGVRWSGTSHATLCTEEILKIMRKAGCSHLIYGYESFSPHVMKTIGKGASPETNIRSFFWTLDAGIRPIPNQILGFPAEDFVSLRENMDAWKRLGIIVKPHFATPYPGSEWFTVNRKSIMDQYGGSLEAFLLDLGDASKITATISKNFNAVEMVALRDFMMQFNYRLIDEYEKVWRRNHNIAEGEPSTLIRKPAVKTRGTRISAQATALQPTLQPAPAATPAL